MPARWHLGPALNVVDAFRPLARRGMFIGRSRGRSENPYPGNEGATTLKASCGSPP
jgi:hypothetical protein